MSTIYMDESGYTGQDLFNPEQPVFVLASTDLTDDEAKEILEPVYQNFQGDELKHSVLGARNRGQKKIVDLVMSLQAVKDRVTTYPFHKKFVLFQKFVDQWLEPVMHQTGHDFYARGENIAFCNMAFTCLIAFEGQDFIDGILNSYQDLMLNPSEEKYYQFWGKLYYMSESCSQNSKDIMQYLTIAPNLLGFDHIAELGEKPQDISFTAALNTVSYWRKRSNDLISIIHDNSSNMSDEVDTWEALTSPELEEQIVGHGDHREMIFPLNVVSTTFADSKTHLQIQLCDLIAGGMAAFFRSPLNPNHKAEYGEQLLEAGILNFSINGIWPSLNIEPTDVDPNHEQADPLDFMGGVLAGLDKQK